MTSETQDSDEVAGATFHEVIFGESGGEQTRFSFTEFRDLTLRHRVRLLMSQPSRFISEAGEEIDRDQAMRFRQRSTPRLEPAPSSDAIPSTDPLGRLATQLRGKEPAQLRTAVRRAAKLVPKRDDHRELLADALLAAAKTASKLEGEEGLFEEALTQFASSVKSPRFAELTPLLAPGTEAARMQVVLTRIWRSLSREQNYGLGLLTVRVRQLLVKFLDADWLCTSQTRALAADLLLAYSVLVPKSSESELHQFYARARKLGDGVLIELAQPALRESLTKARKLGGPMQERLELLARLTSGADHP